MGFVIQQCCLGPCEGSWLRDASPTAETHLHNVSLKRHTHHTYLPDDMALFTRGSALDDGVG